MSYSSFVYFGWYLKHEFDMEERIATVTRCPKCNHSVWKRFCSDCGSEATEIEIKENVPIDLNSVSEDLKMLDEFLPIRFGTHEILISNYTNVGGEQLGYSCDCCHKEYTPEYMNEKEKEFDEKYSDIIKLLESDPINFKLEKCFGMVKYYL